MSCKKFLENHSGGKCSECVNKHNAYEIGKKPGLNDDQKLHEGLYGSDCGICEHLIECLRGQKKHPFSA